MLFGIILAALLVQPSFVQQESPHPADLQSKLETILEQYSLSENSFLQALARLATQFELPMGIEWFKSPPALKSVRLSWKRATVREILESVVKSVPGYQVDSESGIVHVHPDSSFSDQHNFLNLQVDSFQMRNEFVFMGQRRLRDLIRPIVASPPSLPRGAGEAGDYATGVGERRISLKLEKPTVRKVLDKLSLKGEFKVWVITSSGARALTRTGFYRTESLVSSIPVPDAEQPIWAGFRWGDDPISGAKRPDWKRLTED